MWIFRKPGKRLSWKQRKIMVFCFLISWPTSRVGWNNVFLEVEKHSFLILAHLALFPFGRGTHHRWKWSVFSTKRPRLTKTYSDLDDVRILYNINEIRFCTLWQDFEKAVWSKFEQEMSFLLTKSLQSTERNPPCLLCNPPWSATLSVSHVFTKLDFRVYLLKVRERWLKVPTGLLV